MDVLLVVGPLAVMLTLGSILLLLLARTARPSATLPAEVASARRHSTLTVVFATFAMSAVAAGLWIRITGVPDINGSRLASVFPLLGSSAALVALLVGEATWPKPRGAVRSAQLVLRTSWSLTSRGWRLMVTVSTLALMGTLLWGGLLADPSGRRLARDSTSGLGSSSAFPGWYYGLPQLLALLVTIMLCLAVVRIATWRAAVVEADAETDNTLRRASIVRALRVLVVGVLLCLAGDLFIAGEALRSEYAGSWPGPLGATLKAVAAGATALGLGAMLVPAPRLNRDHAVPDSRHVSA